MPEIPEIRIPQIREIPIDTLPTAPPVTLELGPPIIEMPGCVPVHPDAKLNPGLLQDDPGRVGAFCPHGQVPSFRPMDFSPNEFQLIQPAKPRTDDSENEKPQAADVPTIPRLPQPNAPTPKATEERGLPKPFLEKAIDGLPPVEAVVTTTTIALVAATSALVAKPLADLILKLIKPTVKKVVKKVSQVRGKPVHVDSVWERRLAQRDRNRALRALRRALKP
jgi:hypothetical protein